MNKHLAFASLRPLGSRPLRTRYTPNARIRLGLFGVSPWLDVILIAFFVVLLQGRIVLRPGTVVDLPVADDPGVRGGMVAVMLMGPQEQGPMCKVFYDDVLYVLNREGRNAALVEALAGNVRAIDNGSALTVYADRDIDYQYLSQMMELASQAGVREFNLGAKPTEVLP